MTGYAAKLFERYNYNLPTAAASQSKQYIQGVCLYILSHSPPVSLKGGCQRNSCFCDSFQALGDENKTELKQNIPSGQLKKKKKKLYPRNTRFKPPIFPPNRND